MRRMQPAAQRRGFALVLLSVFACAMLGTRADAAVSVDVRYQLRGHLPELGEQPTMRLFLSQAEYDKFRANLGDANVFPQASSLFMSFDKDILALYARGNDIGGRCIATDVFMAYSSSGMGGTAEWESGTCGAPATAHYPFILLAISRTANDGLSWVPLTPRVCLSVSSDATSACAPLGAVGGPSPVVTVGPSASAGRTVTPSVTAPSLASTGVATASPAASRSPIAAASPTPPEPTSGPNVLGAGALVGLGVLVVIVLAASRRPRPKTGSRIRRQ